MELVIDKTKIGRKTLFDQIHLNIPERAMTVVEGKNGTGKTVFLRRLFEAYEDAGSCPIFVEQGNEYVFSHKNVLENICLSEEQEEQLQARQLLSRHSLEYLETRKTETLSGGEKRLICIMRAVYFAKDADVLLLDEPSNDLDYIRVQMLAELLTELKQTCTIVVVTHDARISALADLHLMIADGQIQAKNNFPWVSSHLSICKTKKQKSVGIL